MTAAEFKAARKALGMTQQQLADALELDVTTISRIERDRWGISRPVELALAHQACPKIALTSDAIATIRFALNVAQAEAERDVEVVKGTREEQATKVRAGTIGKLATLFLVVDRVNVDTAI